MNSIVQHKLPEVLRLCKKHRVERLYLFGSANTEDFNEHSDIDFLISFQNTISLEEYADNFFDLLFALEDLLGRQIDLVNEKTLSNPYFIRSVEETKQLVYAA